MCEQENSAESFHSTKDGGEDDDDDSSYDDPPPQEEEEDSTCKYMEENGKPLPEDVLLQGVPSGTRPRTISGSRFMTDKVVMLPNGGGICYFGCLFLVMWNTGNLGTGVRLELGHRGDCTSQFSRREDSEVHQSVVATYHEEDKRIFKVICILHANAIYKYELFLLMRANENHFHSNKWDNYACRCQFV